MMRKRHHVTIILNGLVACLATAGCHESEHDHAGHDHSKHEEGKADHKDDDHSGHGHEEHGEEHVPEPVEMDEETRREHGVRVETAGPGDIQPRLSLAGEVQLEPDRIAHITPRVDGIAVEVARRLGDKVRAGDTLAVLESREAAEARAEALSAREELEAARLGFEREESLQRDGVSAGEDLITARQRFRQAGARESAAAQKLVALGLAGSADVPASARYELRAPIDGEIIEKHLVLGEAIPADTVCFVVADLSHVNVSLNLFTGDLPQIAVGSKARIRSRELDLTAEGTVRYVSPVMDEVRRTATVLIALDNPDGRWRPGMYVEAGLAADARHVPVRVAARAIQTVEGRKSVFVEKAGKLVPVPVTTGAEDGEWVEVTGGLEPGTRYAAEGSYLLKADLEKAGAGHDH